MIIFLILLSTFFSTVKTEAPSPKCPSNMIQSKKDPNICYWFVANATSFDDAENFCVENGGHLAPVLNQISNYILSGKPFLNANSLGSFSVNALEAFKNSVDFWIGGKSYSINGAVVWLWTWQNSFIFYSDWDHGQPSKNGCITSNINSAIWSSADCSVLKPFVCQIPAVIDVCDPEWSYFKPPNATGMCYKYMAQANITFLQAQNVCLNQQSNLVSIHSPEENSFVAKMGEDKTSLVWYNEGVFIGLQYQNLTWHWLDGSKLDYDNWGPKRPFYLVDTSGAFMYPDYPPPAGDETPIEWFQKWDDFDSGYYTQLNRFICKRNPNWVSISEKML